MAGSRHRRWPIAVVLALIALGCETYTDRVSCGMGTVLDDDNECVPPPTPDGGVPVEDCADLCALAVDFDEDQLACLADTLAFSGPPPDVCLGDLTAEGACDACLGEAAIPASSCATAGAVCQ